MDDNKMDAEKTDDRKADDRKSDNRKADNRKADDRNMEIRRTKIKICGLTRLKDMDVLNACRPDFAGLVFAQSRRQVSEELAEKLRAR